MPYPPAPRTHAPQKELREIERDTKSGVSVALKSTPGSGGDDLTKLTGYVEGPRDTPYEGGYFVIDIELGECVPMAWCTLVRLTALDSLCMCMRGGRA